MSNSYAAVKGTRDLLPPDTRVWGAVEALVREVFGLYGFDEIRTPILEHTELFVRGVGESSDIVGKEMYTFERSGRSLTLRPENTAGVARAFVQNSLQQLPQPVKLFYVGPQFRYERKQAHRYRQFNQIGAEVFGDEGPLVDAELLLMLRRFLGRLGLQDLVVLLNTVGDPESRRAFGAALVAYLEPYRSDLSEDSQRRLATNPLRILDTKSPAEKELLVDAPRLADHLSDESREHFDRVRQLLEDFSVPYRVDERLVRGLDYYTRTVFEIVSEGLGAHNAILGGGRYDGLVADLGGPAIPGIGFAIGQDRLIEVLSDEFRRQALSRSPVGLVPLGEAALARAMVLAEDLRGAGIEVQCELAGRSLKASLRALHKRGVIRVAILGETEMEKDVVMLKDFASGEQQEVALADLPGELTSDAPEGQRS